MKYTLGLVFSLALAGAATAATGVFGSYAEITTGSSTVYVAQGTTGNPSFQGADFGTFTLGDSLSLSNASLLTFKNSGGDVTGAEIQWRVYETGETPGSYATIALNFGSNAPSTDLGGNGFSGGGDQEWRGLSTGSVDLLGATSGNGDYTLEIFYRASTNEGDRFSNNGGSDYTATFTVVPEPSSAALLGLGGLALIMRRRK